MPSERRLLITACRELFAISNMIGTDIADVRVMEVEGRDFAQQPGGTGYHICFSVSHHVLGKARTDVGGKLEQLARICKEG